MPKAKHNCSTPKRWSDPAEWPEDVYCARINGDCLAPILPDRAAVLCKKSEPVRAGDFVIVWFRPEVLSPTAIAQSWVKRLKTDLPPKLSEGSVILEQLNPPGIYTVRYDAVLAVHKAIGFVPDEKSIKEAAHPDDMIVI